MMPNAFKDEDSQTVIDFLNMVAKHAKFELNTSEIIQYFKLLSQMQQTILPKIESHVFEVKKVVEPEPKKKKTRKKKDK